MNRPAMILRRLTPILLLMTIITPTAAAQSVPEGVWRKLDPTLLRQLQQASPEDSFQFLITIRSQSLRPPVPTGGSAAEQRVTLVASLQAAAAAAQSGVRLQLDDLAREQHVKRYQSFWVFNGLAVTGNRQAILTLAARDDVVSIRPDRWLQWIVPDDDATELAASEQLDWGISRVRADQVWSALQIDGQGVVVATMDTGVDWNHPVLQPSYRGWHEGTVIHSGSWFDATGQGALYPIDAMGHGTHVTGLLAGQDGFGVAPGSRWIAVRAFDNYGFGLDSWIHAGFQWLLAPAGDAALAPDIVSNSWSNPNAWNTEFLPDVQALLAAGILPVFAAGNNGPDPSSVGAPGSYAEALTVGASDPDDEVAYFSGRGPSPFDDVKPDIVAPGVAVLSTLPGGTYGEMSGTSMATPIVAGVAALIQQADSSLSIQGIIETITRTAVAVGPTWPNSDAGWGRVDALASVASIANPGYLAGTVRRPGNLPVAGATVRATEHGGGATSATLTASDGHWSLITAPGIYDVEASAFGFVPRVESGVTVVTGTTTLLNFNLTPLPGGTINGVVTSADTGDPLAAVVQAIGTPVTTTAATDGAYSLELPAGTYTLTAEHWGHRIAEQPVEVVVGNTSTQDFVLGAAPTLLLVDSGAWYYGSQISYYQIALDDQHYLYHDWRIKHSPQDTPVITDLMPYDAVIWSSPADSPGYVDAGEVISGYLASGGNLFVSGQDVGYWDSGASGWFWSPYYSRKLYAGLVADNSGSLNLQGTEDGPLHGLALELNGPENADNQITPDSVKSTQVDFAGPIATYASAGAGGLQVGRCLPYRSSYLSFGFEGMGDRADRAEVMGRALDWFFSPRPAVGTELSPTRSDLIAPAGSTVTHTIRLRNTGESGTGDTYTISTVGGTFTTTVLSPSITLSPCQTTLVNVLVDIPPGLPVDSLDQAILTASSQLSPTVVSTALLTTKSPAPIVLIDDDRWYNQEDVYRDSLAAGGFRYDYWDARVEPSDQLAGTLAMYPMAVWFTGYDWYSPLTGGETAELEQYLADGGRLFLSSQEALYYQSDSALAHRYLGVLHHSEDVTPTVAYGAQGRLTLPAEMQLTYPFRNYSDGIIPAEGAAVEMYADNGWPSGISNLGRDEETWRSIFLSFPFEALPSASRTGVMNQAVGWLGWLGDSTYGAGDRTLAAGETTTFTATVRNNGPESVTAVFSSTLPLGLTLIPDSLEGGDLDEQVVRWAGTLESGGEHTVHYAGTVGASLTVTATFYHAEHDLAFHKAVRLFADTPDLSLSELHAPPDTVVPGQPVSYALLIQNSGSAATHAATGDWTLPTDLIVMTETLQASSGLAILDGDTVRWTGQIAPDEAVSVGIQALTLTRLEHDWLSSAAVLDDGMTETIVRGHILELKPLSYYFPVVMR